MSHKLTLNVITQSITSISILKNDFFEVGIQNLLWVAWYCYGWLVIDNCF
jgi:hypothetical protein